MKTLLLIAARLFLLQLDGTSKVIRTRSYGNRSPVQHRLFLLISLVTVRRMTSALNDPAVVFNLEVQMRGEGQNREINLFINDIIDVFYVQ